MKKTLKYLILLILIIPFHVKAEGIENFYINATLKENGDLLVEEYFNLTGKYNGYEKIIQYKNPTAYEFNPDSTSYGGSSIHNGDDIILHDVRALKVNPDFDFSKIKGDKFKKVRRANKGDYGVYTQTKNTNGHTYLIYLPSKKNKAFYVKYTIKNIAILHEDVGEIGWNIIGNNLRENVTNFKATINFPNNKNELRGWAHGPLNGEIKIVNNQKIEVTINDLSAYREMDIRATFDKEIIKDSPKKTNVVALDKIIKYETDKAEQANYERENFKKQQEITAETYLIEFENNIKRYKYDMAQQAILNVKDNQKREELLNRLAITEQKLIEIEKQEAKESIKMAKKYNNFFWYRTAFDKISDLEESELKTNLTNELEKVKKVIKEKEKKLEKRNYSIGTILLIVIMIITLYVYIKYDKELKPNFNHKYYRDIPNDYHPTKISYLFKRKITDDAFSASILDLIEKKIIRYEKLDNKNYILYNDSEKFDNISSLENKLIKVIFNKKKKIELEELKKYAKTNYSSFASNWRIFKKSAMDEAKKEELYTKDIKNKAKEKIITKYKERKNIALFIGLNALFICPPVSIFVWIYYLYAEYRSARHKSKSICVMILSICIIVALAFNISIFANQHFVKNSIKYMWLIILLAIISIIYTFSNTKKTEKGINEYAKWKAFKNFLKDFGTLDTKELPEIVMWEKYLVYATVLGCADDLAKVMKVRIEELNINSEKLDLYDLTTINYINRVVTRNITDSVNTAIKTDNEVRAANSSSSSGFGGGGGFSSGGGSFGGGGGGGRF